MQEIIPEKETTALFAYKTHRIRTLKIDDEIWFVAKDICDVLEIATSELRRVDKDEKQLLTDKIDILR